MAPETVREHLETVLGNEQVPAEPGALTLLSRAARGSMRDALSLTDQAIAFGAGQVDESTVRQMLGAVDRQQVFALIEALARADGQAVVALVDQARAVGLNAGSLLEDMAQVLQRMAVVQAVGAAEVPGDADPDQRMEHQLAQQLPRDETQLLYSICIHGRAELGLAPDEYAGLTMVLLRLLAFKPEGTEKKTPDSARLSAPAAKPATPAAQPPVPAVAPGPVPVVMTGPDAAKPTPPMAAQPVPVALSESNESMDASPLSGQREEVNTPAFKQDGTSATPRQAAPIAVSTLDSRVAAPQPAPSAARAPAEIAEPAPALAEPSPQVAPSPEPAVRQAPTVDAPVPQPVLAESAPEIVKLRPEQAYEIDEHLVPAPAAPEPAAAPEPEFIAEDEDDDLGPAPLPPWEELVELDAAPMAPHPPALAAAPVVAPARGALRPLPVLEAPDEPAAPPFHDVDPEAHPVVSVPLARASRDEAPMGQSKPLPPLVPTEEGEFWHGLVTQLVRDEAINGFVRELALQSQLLRRDAASWRLACTSGLLGSAGTVDRLQAALSEAGYAVKLQVQQSEVSDTPALRNQHAQARKLQAARALLEADPFVRALQRDFAAKIIDHSVKPL
jgi:DNA polymerase-3 subunit gamma/tau